MSTEYKSKSLSKEAQETATTLNGFINECASKLGAMTDKGQHNTMVVQARFVAMYLAGKRLETGWKWEENPISAALLDGDDWSSIAAENKITPELEEQARKIAEGDGGVPQGSAPASGDIADKLGYITHDIKCALLMAQAAQRTLNSMNPARDRVSTKEFNLVKDNPKWKFIGSPGDPDDLQKAQSINFLGEVLQAASLLADIPPEETTISAAQDTLKVLSVDFLRSAAQSLGHCIDSHGHSAADRIDDLADEIAELYGFEPDLKNQQMLLDAASEVIGRALAALKDTLIRSGKISEAEWPQKQIHEKLAIVARIPASTTAR